VKHLNGSKWIARIFEAKAAHSGGVVRRKVMSVESHASELDLKNAVENRGFHLLRCGDQYIVLCNRDDLEVIRKGNMDIIQ
jgi:hypothetical protein